MCRNQEILPGSASLFLRYLLFSHLLRLLDTLYIGTPSQVPNPDLPCDLRGARPYPHDMDGRRNIGQQFRFNVLTLGIGFAREDRNIHPFSRKCGKLMRTRWGSGALTGGKLGVTISTRQRLTADGAFLRFGQHFVGAATFSLMLSTQAICDRSAVPK
ncbi:MAG: hypothetical protein J6386_05405 [Candidatus Synoicihabitans palmerolidicus]|nr:hypothetical protein [Candidatus Synoicihabitans palmerolidicus]